VLRDLAAEKKFAFMQSLLGKPVEAITLNTVHNSTHGESTEALTDNYLKLQLTGRHQPNQWLKARIQDVVNGALLGSIC
jgi:tRNA A37 methylthiotransferase MiaB